MRPRRSYTFPKLDLASLVTPTLFYSVTKSTAVGQSVDPALPCLSAILMARFPVQLPELLPFHLWSPSLLERSPKAPQTWGILPFGAMPYQALEA